MDVRIWSVAFSKLNSSDTERPNVRFGIVVRLRKDLRTHPIGASDERLSLGMGMHIFSRYSEICEFGVALVIQQYISSLDIPMDDLPRMQVIQPFEDSLQNRGDLILVKFLQLVIRVLDG